MPTKIDFIGGNTKRCLRAMHLYQHGMDLTMISQWLGHKQVETTLIYYDKQVFMERKKLLPV